MTSNMQVNLGRVFWWVVKVVVHFCRPKRGKEKPTFQINKQPYFGLNPSMLYGDEVQLGKADISLALMLDSGKN